MQVEKILQELKNKYNLRSLKPLKHEGLFVYKEGKKLLNLAGNDYLALASKSELVSEFLAHSSKENLLFSSSASRSLSGNFEIYERLESHLKSLYLGKEALIFNSGYHLNSSCVAVLSSLDEVLFLADKQIHASLIDGLRLSKAKFLRYAHNDTKALENLLEKYHNKYKNIIILSEALFSMDGDFAPLKELVRLKKSYANTLLYLDEAHSIASFGKNGLGLAYDLELVKEVDFLVLTFGKALASVGACMLCSKAFKELFINKARALIYSTALPPINIAWSLFIFERLKDFDKERARLLQLAHDFKKELTRKGYEILGQAYILSLICGDNKKATKLALKLEDKGYFAPAIKEPTVSKNTARLRFSLNANLNQEELHQLSEIL